MLHAIPTRYRTAAGGMCGDDRAGMRERLGGGGEKDQRENRSDGTMAKEISRTRGKENTHTHTCARTRTCARSCVRACV